jgi:hypothetical protein
MAAIDWSYWRQKYVTGEDTLTLKALSEYQEAPAYQTIKNRANKEDWADQRKRYRYQRSTDASTQPGVKETVEQAAKIIDAAEMITRHAGLAKLMGAIAQRELILLRQKQEVKPAISTGLKPAEILNLAKAAIEIERLTEGLATQRQEIDLSGLSDAELERLANGK